MKKSVLVTILPICISLFSCTSDHKPATAAAPVAATAAAAQAAAKTETFNLVGSEWVLDDLAGGGVVSGVRATLSFPEAGKIAGNGSCNRFFGMSEIAGKEIKFTGLGSSRMACPEPIMNQETKYLNALQAAEHFEWKDPYLLIYSNGLDKPLRFTRASPANAQ
jgi:heat shock protein HslJ